jgi:hypothetical protein
VVSDLADPVESYDLLGRACVEVGGIAPLRLDPAGAQGDASMLEALPESLTLEIAQTCRSAAA